MSEKISLDSSEMQYEIQDISSVAMSMFPE